MCNKCRIKLIPGGTFSTSVNVFGPALTSFVPGLCRLTGHGSLGASQADTSLLNHLTGFPGFSTTAVQMNLRCRAPSCLSGTYHSLTTGGILLTNRRRTGVIFPVSVGFSFFARCTKVSCVNPPPAASDTPAETKHLSTFVLQLRAFLSLHAVFHSVLCTLHYQFLRKIINVLGLKHFVWFLFISAALSLFHPSVGLHPPYPGLTLRTTSPVCTVSPAAALAGRFPHLFLSW